LIKGSEILNSGIFKFFYRIFNIRTMRSVAKIDSGKNSLQLRRPEKRLLKL